MKSRAAMPENEQSNIEGLSGMLRWMGMSVFVGAVLMGTARRANAAQFTVTNTTDDPTPGSGSLRDAIAQANATAGADTIVFDNAVTGTISLYNNNVNGPLTITDSVTITGPGAANLTVSYPVICVTPNPNGRIFIVDDGTGTQLDVTISGLTIANASAGSSQGGAIFNRERLTISNSVITGNRAGTGAAAHNYGSLTISNCTISNNRAYYNGGAFYNNGYLRVSASTISNNTADFNGGGIYANNNLRVENSTISTNYANYGDGGGIFARNGYSTTIFNSTITENTARGGPYGFGGGVRVYNQSLYMSGTIIANNYAENNYNDFNGNMRGSNNLVRDNSGFNVYYGNNNLFNIDPRLGPLQDNGGPTFTHGLLQGSPCFNTGANLLGLTTDQRGLPRISGGATDIGAFEGQVLSFVVKNLNDSGPDSLRQCIIDANTAPTPDFISFATGLSGTITLSTGQLDVTDSVTISGPGSATIGVSGNNASRVFNIVNNSAVLNVSISGLTVKDGSASIGAGIYNKDEHLTLSNCVITNNHATGDGGGIWADGFAMSLSIDNSTITANSSGDDGGGIYIEDTGPGGVQFTNTVFSNNTATGQGGAIYLYDPDSNITIDRCTISGNTAGSTGGGIYLYSFDSGTFTIRNSTINNNSATKGGGIYLYATDYTTIIENCTISGNKATAGSGGGVFVPRAYTGNLIIRNSTITLNTATSGGAGVYTGSGTPTFYSTIISGNQNSGVADDFSGTADGASANNLIGVDVGVNGMTNNTNGNQIGTAATPLDPQLGPLQNNGGPTFTHAITASSLAHDRGSNPAGLRTDQRGTGFRRVSGSADVGAFEFQDPPLTFVVKNLNDSGPDSLRDCVNAANSHNNVPDIITFEAGLTGTIVLTSGHIVASDSVDIQGPGASIITVSGNNNSRIFTFNDYNQNYVQNFSVSKLTLTGGNGSGGNIDGDGGAIFLGTENLTIDGCVISGNTAPVRGGAVSTGYDRYGQNTIEGGTLIVKNSTISGNNAGGKGGGIYLYRSQNAVLEITNCKITGNTAGSDGGGVFFYADNLGKLTIDTSVIDGNTAGGDGGGIFFYSDDGQEELTIKNSTISNNQASGAGGGLWIWGNGNDGADTVLIQNSTFSGNQSTNGGAIAIDMDNSQSTIVLENCTISGNSAKSSGGGIGFFYAVDVTIRNCTITKNIADSDSLLPINPPYGQYGGGISYIQSGGGGLPGPNKVNITLTSSIVAGNTDNSGNFTHDINAILMPESSDNIIGVETGMTGVTNGTNGNQVGTVAQPVDPKLGPLQDNGGTLMPDGTHIKTHALLLGSPALDLGSNAAALTTDNRGTGFNRDAGPKTDVGAFENQLPIAALAGPLTLIAGNSQMFDATASIDPDGDGLTYSWDINGDGVFGDGNFTGPNPTFTAAQLAALGIGDANETFTVTVQVSDGRHFSTASTTLTVVLNAPRPVVNSPVVTPNPVVVDETVTVTLEAQDPQGRPLTFTYDWGDGTVNNSNTHVYTTPGLYTVNVTVSNGVTSTVSQFALQVLPGRPTLLTKVKGNVNFNTGTDVAHITMVIPTLKAGFSPAGKAVTLDFGGLVRTFTLDAKGKATFADGKASLQIKKKKGAFPGGPARLLVNLKGALAASWKDEGIDAAKPTKRDSVTFAIKLTVDGIVFYGTTTPTLKQTVNAASFQTPHTIIPKRP